MASATWRSSGVIVTVNAFLPVGESGWMNLPALVLSRIVPAPRRMPACLLVLGLFVLVTAGRQALLLQSAKKSNIHCCPLELLYAAIVPLVGSIPRIRGRPVEVNQYGATKWLSV